jgi:DNA-binding transcriptional LysR family regulator
MALDSLDDLRVFRQIVSAGGISAAARALRRSKNAVSQRLARLEVALGTRLADRTTREFRLTDNGERLWRASEELLAAAGRTEAALSGDGALDGKVRVAVRSALAAIGLGDELAQLLAGAPGLQLQLAVVDDDAELRRGGYDLAVQPGRLRDSALVARRLGTARYQLAASPAYVRAAGAPRRPTELVRHQCLRRLGEAPELTWSLVGHGERTATARLGGRVECSDARLLCELIYAGVGIGLLPAAVVRRGQRDGTLERVLPTWEYAPIPVWVVSPKGRLALPRVARVVEVLARAVAALN